jgi:hypothetical protein
MAVFATFQTLLHIASIIARGKCGPVGDTGRLYLHLRRNGIDSSSQANNTQTSTCTHVLRGRALFIFIVWPASFSIFPYFLTVTMTLMHRCFYASTHTVYASDCKNHAGASHKQTQDEGLVLSIGATEAACHDGQTFVRRWPVDGADVARYNCKAMMPHNTYDSDYFA